MREVSERKKRIIIDGKSFPLPRKYHDLIFRDERSELDKKFNLRPRRTALSVQVASYERGSYLETFGQSLRRRAERNLDKIDYLAICQILSDEETALEDRAKAAKQYYLNSLKKQKYG